MKTTTQHPKRTPWGGIQHKRRVADGIYWLSTASHGGYWIAPWRRLSMPAQYRAFKTFAGANWFEEDCDWAIVVLSFPDCFSAEQHDGADITLRNHIEYFEKNGVQS